MWSSVRDGSWSPFMYLGLCAAVSYLTDTVWRLVYLLAARRAPRHSVTDDGLSEVWVIVIKFDRMINTRNSLRYVKLPVGFYPHFRSVLVALKKIGVMTLIFCSYVTLSVTWPLDWLCGVFCRRPMRLPGTVTKIWGLENFGVTILIFWANVTSSVTWSLNSQYMFSYKWLIETVSLSRMVDEILHVKHTSPHYHWECSDHHFSG